MVDCSIRDVAKAALTKVQPVRPIAGYIGGKRNLAKRLVERIGRVPHQLYAEPFVGMGGVFFRRTTMPRCEVINDVSTDVVTLFRILQRHFPQFMDVLKWQVASRDEFERLRAQDADTLTDLERAARFLYLQKLAFGGKVEGRSFGVTRTASARFDLTKLVPMLEDVHERLSRVVIERLDWADFIARYDTADTLFYLDPPYWGCEEDYGVGVFARGDFERMAAQLAGIEGQFILSINDTSGVREVFERFDFEEVGLNYSVGIAPTAARELIISNRKAA